MNENLPELSDVRRVRSGLCFWLKRWYRSPLAYVIEMLGDVPTHQQAEVLKAFEHHRFVAVKSGHGIGKSKLTGWLVNWWLDTRGKRAPITGAGGDQLSDIVWPEVVAVNRKKWGWVSRQYESTMEELRLRSQPESWKAVLRTARADNDDALQGFHDCMFFIDEGSGVRDGIFEVASGAMGDPGAFGFMDGNPTRLSGYMFRVFHQPSFWYTMSFSSERSLAEEEYSYSYVDPLGEIRWITTHGRQTRQWIANMRTEYGELSNVYRVRVLGEFAHIGSDSLIEERSLANVFEASGRAGANGRKYIRRMGIDPAWTGEDDTGIVVREGNLVLHVESWHGFDLVESFARIRVLFDEWKCDVAHVDVAGVGAGLYDMLNHAAWHGRNGYPLVKVLVSEAAPKDGDADCRTLRDWLWWKSRQYFRGHNVRFMGLAGDREWAQLVCELQAPGYKLVGGKVVAESKDDMKKRGVRSPNLADALNTTFCGDFETFSDSYGAACETARKSRLRRRSAPRSWKTR